LSRPVVLIGLMGAGKTRVGRELARLLGRPWADLDAELVKAGKASIARQFARFGEEGFRRREAALLARLLRRRDVVLSSGGGVVLRPENRRLLRRQHTVYLEVPQAVLLKRLRGPELKKRPLFKGQDPAALLRRVRRQRASFYRASALFRVQAGRASAKALAQRIALRLKAF
jgi:shikimate kinase